MAGVLKLLSSVKDINFDEGVVPMNVAIEEGLIAVVKILIEAGASVYACDEEGNCSLHVACRVGNDKIVEMLLCTGMDPDEKNRWRDTPLLVAVIMDQELIVRMLLCAGADPNTTFVEPLLAHATDITIMKILLAAGADPQQLIPSEVANTPEESNVLAMPPDHPEFVLIRSQLKKMKSQMMGGLQSTALTLLAASYTQKGFASPLFNLRMQFLGREIVELLLTSSF